MSDYDDLEVCTHGAQRSIIGTGPGLLPILTHMHTHTVTMSKMLNVIKKRTHGPSCWNGWDKFKTLPAWNAYQMMLTPSTGH